MVSWQKLKTWLRKSRGNPRDAGRELRLIKGLLKDPDVLRENVIESIQNIEYHEEILKQLKPKLNELLQPMIIEQLQQDPDSPRLHALVSQLEHLRAQYEGCRGIK